MLIARERFIYLRFEHLFVKVVNEPLKVHTICTAHIIINVMIEK